MKKILLATLTLSFLAGCQPEFTDPVTEEGYYGSGQADLSTYVAVGNSLTSGYADGAMYLDAQQNSYPAILAEKFALAGGGEFTQPLMQDNLGGLLLNGQQVASTRLVLRYDNAGNPSPVNLEGTPTTEITNILEGPFNNMGVPGAKSYHLVAPGYGNPAGIGTTANAYFVRMASSPETNVLADVMAQEPTFFSLWIGSNDILGYALSGGTGTDQTGNLNPATYGGSDITDPNVFAGVYSQLVQTLTSGGASGVLLNIPEVTGIPFFNTIPGNALVLSAEQAGQLTLFFQAVAGITTQGLIAQGVPAAQAQALAAQYAITFNAGPNRWIIDVPVSAENPLGFRQMTEEELLLLTIDRTALTTQGYGSVAITPEVLQVLGKLQNGLAITEAEAGLVIGAVNGIDDKDALDVEEIAAVEAARTAYNTTISALATQNNLVLVDAAAFFETATTAGYPYDGGVLTAEFGTGGLFSLDGIHLTQRGYAAVANEIIRAMNAQLETRLPEVNPGTYPTVFVE